MTRARSARTGRLSCALLVVLASVAGTALTTGCGGDAKAPHVEAQGPAWQDMIEGNEALVAVVRPKALLRDAVFGPLFRAAVAATLSREGSAPSLDVLSAAEELVVVVSADARDGTTLVLSGVDASRSPDRVSDERGQALFRPGADARNVSEWVSTQGKDASLFVLPHRTWVIASNGMRQRAREAFANPTGRAVPSYGDDKSLAILRFEGESLIRGAIQGRFVMPSVTKNLESVTAELLPDKRGLNVTLRYKNDDQAGFSALALEDMKKRLAQDSAHRFAWVTSTAISREGNRDVRAHVDLPADFIEQLKRVSPQDLSTF